MPKQLRMIWPTARRNIPPIPEVPSSYRLRTFQPGDEEAFFTLMARVGWEGWDPERLAPWYSRTLPEGWFVVTTRERNTLVASAMALRDVGEFGVPGGELGWVACAPEHRRRGLGTAVSAAATRRLLEEGYTHVHLYTEPWRLPAIRLYMRLGYVPYIDGPDAREMWRNVWPSEPLYVLAEGHRVGDGIVVAYPFAPECKIAEKPDFRPGTWAGKRTEG